MRDIKNVNIGNLRILFHSVAELGYEPENSFEWFKMQNEFKKLVFCVVLLLTLKSFNSC